VTVNSTFPSESRLAAKPQHWKLDWLLSVVAQIFAYAHHEQYRHHQIYSEYEQLFDVLVAEFQTHSAIVAVPL
jgi:hypothetical protein